MADDSIPSSQSNTARDSRRHRALVAYLLTVPDLDYEKIDWAHPLLSSVTVPEFRKAVSEIKAVPKDDLVEMYDRILGDDESLGIFVPTETWVPLQALRYQQLQRKSIIAHSCEVIWSPVDIFQVNYQREIVVGQPTIVYLIQSMLTKSDGVWYVLQRPASGPIQVRKLRDLDKVTYPLVRPFQAPIAPRIAAPLRTWSKFENLKPNDPSMPLHQQIANLQ